LIRLGRSLRELNCLESSIVVSRRLRGCWSFRFKFYQCRTKVIPV